MADSSIGEFQFVSLTGEVGPPTEQIGPPIVRPGVDGVGLWKTGQRGRPFRLRSAVDYADLDTARNKLSQYRALIGADPILLKQDGYDFDGEGNFKVAVLDVRATQLRKVETTAGGLNPPSNAKLVCEWTLIAISSGE